MAYLLPEDGDGLAARIYRPQGWLSPVLAVDGRMVGVWKHERRGGRVDVSIEPFVPVKPVVKKAAEQEAEHLGTFLGGTASVSWVL